MTKITILSIPQDRLEAGLRCVSELDGRTPEQLAAEGLAFWLNLGSSAREALRRLDGVAIEKERVEVLREVSRLITGRNFMVSGRVFSEATAHMRDPTTTDEQIDAEAERMIAEAGFADFDVLEDMISGEGPEMKR
ncbi:hypothetical protein SAE02_77540 [Skermanella aerolata]|uniref:Uncharacterized protein n=1 Tax=Skermanella aerolata TaxID=393310 RepID=A0A512E4D9_9PROT|nr:hypothetical protein [Skermanella aerolata]KJB89989.1 hypothetical protein N826_08735 [Skermanella aerolata KACC 11604]GEO43606.1 hypothetical protein SAE02_77540 [Skermanella aerolata]